MLRTLFVSAIFVGGLRAAFRDRFAALLLYLWFALFRPQDWLWIDVTSLRLSLVLGLVLLVPCLFTRVLPDLRHPLGAGTVAFFVIASLGWPFAIAPQVTWEWVDYLARLFLVLLLAMRLIRTREQLLMTTAAIAASFGFHTAKAGLAFLLGGGVRFYDGMNGGSFVDNNGYALGAMINIFLLVGSAQNIFLLVGSAQKGLGRGVDRANGFRARPKPLTPEDPGRARTRAVIRRGRSGKRGRQKIGVRWLRYGFFASAGLSVFTVVGTFSRAGFLALVASVLVFVLLQRKRFFALISLVGCVLVVITVVPLPEGYVERLHTIETYKEVGDGSALSRQHFWRVAIEMALDRPLFGVGLRGYESAYNRYDFLHGQYGSRRSVHSSHFQVLAEMGFLGATVWMWLFAYAYWTLFRVRTRSRNPLMSREESQFFFTMANAMIASITAFLVGGAFIALALNDLTWLTFVLVVALDRLSREALGSQSSPPPSKAMSRRKRATVHRGIRRSVCPGSIEGRDDGVPLIGVSLEAPQEQFQQKDNPYHNRNPL